MTDETTQKLISAIITLFVGVAILLVGMRMMSSGLKKTIGQGIKGFFKKTQNNPMVGLGIGTAVTACIQSSDATNAMVIGFINAKAMTMYQGLCIMLGAYIGTTITGVFASFSSLSFSSYFLLFAVFGVAMMLFKKEKIKNIGEILAGLGLLFFGLALMKEGFKNDDITNACKTLFTTINNGPLLYLIGVVLTAMIQSSSALTSIVIAMVGGNALSLSSGLYIVLGATLGTVTNTLLTCIGGNVQGKRTAIIAFFLRMITSLIMMGILVIFETPISTGLHFFAIEGKDELPIALFTVFYNIIFMPALIPFLKPTISLFEKLIKDKSVGKYDDCVHFIDEKILGAPNIALMQTGKEITNMYEIAFDNYNKSVQLLITGDYKDEAIINKQEGEIDYLNNRITNYLIALSSRSQSSSETQIGTYFHVINDIERVGDHACNILKMKLDMDSKAVKFSSSSLKQIELIDTLEKEMFTLTKKIFVESDQKSLSELHDLKERLMKCTSEMLSKHYEQLKNREIDVEVSPFYTTLITEFERIADHLINVGYSVNNPLGNDEDPS